MSKQVIQRAVLAALGHVKPDYRSPKQLDETACVIADFVVAELERDRLENCKHACKNGAGQIGSDGSSKTSWFCLDCGKSGEWETPARVMPTVALW